MCSPGCRAEKQRRYREANRDAIAEKKRRYYEANRDAIAEKQRRYREANRDAIAEKKRRYREANRDAIAEKQRRYREELAGRIIPDLLATIDPDDIAVESIVDTVLAGESVNGIHPDDRAAAAVLVLAAGGRTTALRRLGYDNRWVSGWLRWHDRVSS
jgi:hypothetical protein